MPHTGSPARQWNPRPFSKVDRVIRNATAAPDLAAAAKCAHAKNIDRAVSRRVDHLATKSLLIPEGAFAPPGFENQKTKPGPCQRSSQRQADRATTDDAQIERRRCDVQLTYVQNGHCYHVAKTAWNLAA